MQFKQTMKLTSAEIDLVLKYRMKKKKTRKLTAKKIISSITDNPILYGIQKKK